MQSRQYLAPSKPARPIYRRLRHRIKQASDQMPSSHGYLNHHLLPRRPLHPCSVIGYLSRIRPAYFLTPPPSHSPPSAPPTSAPVTLHAAAAASYPPAASTKAFRPVAAPRRLSA